MPKKDKSNAAPAPAPEPEEPQAPPEAEEPQIVKDLKEIDDRYLKLEREYEKEINELMAKYNEKQRPFLEERAKVLAEGSDASTGTPALKSFWLQALQNHPAFEEEIESHDEPVLQYLKDITFTNLDPTDRQKGCRFEFLFVANPYFENTVLSKEYHTSEKSPYTGDVDVLKTEASNINWKPGKDVTVEKVKKQTKGKKGKQSKEKEEPRPSFFRSFFRSMKKGAPLPDDIDPHEIAMQFGGDDDDDDDMDEDKIMELMMEQDLEVGEALRDNIIPFAVRWYTGEADPRSMDSDDDEDEESEIEDDDEDDDDDDDDDDEEEDEPPKKGNKKKGGNKKAGDGEKPKQEECKQQ